MTEVTARPTAVGENAGSNDKASLLIRLDELLEQYLKTLDRYQRAQQQLTTHLTSGYLSLAQANFNNQSGTRYGPDYYDERMQAQRTVTLSAEEANASFAISTEVSGPKKLGSATQAQADASPASSVDLSAEEPTFPMKDDIDDTSANDSKMSGDPLRWFGILVPPALRSAQSSFVSAVEGYIPELATITKDLRKQEVDIGRLRKQIRKS